ncbi:hypothetical protein [Amorphus coralli]|uniref:hypothetical protein n=1 Tax=Amorphus coralli TaxID=340680 RepID=UPI00037D8E08|nr:hypothetical protein [Amorphus coralli]
MTAHCPSVFPADPILLLDLPPFTGSRALSPPAMARWAAGCRYAVAIPARNEEEAIGPCLQAVVGSMRAARRAGGVVVLVNNSTDDTYARACRILSESGLAHLVLSVGFPEPLANAGTARRLALDLASALIDPRGTLMTTDADTRVGRGWVDANLAGIDRGADLVCGAIDIDPVEAGPVLALMGPGYRSEAEYVDLSIELGARLDPRAHDPLPRHRCAGGASLAVRRSVYSEIGGMPTLACGEDRAFVAAAEARDLFVTYSSDARVTTSFRLDGRASGGMATTLAERLAGDHAPADDTVEPASRAALRAWARGRLRGCFEARLPFGAEVLRALGVTPGNEASASGLFFGEVWRRIEERSPLLERQRISLARVADELPAMRRLVTSLRGGGPVPATPNEARRWIAHCCARETEHG